MSYLEQLREMKEKKIYDSDKLNMICNNMEEEIGEAEMWSTLRPGFSFDELLENLEYIAREEDL